MNDRLTRPRLAKIGVTSARLVLGMALLIGVLMAVAHYLPIPEGAKSPANPLQAYVLQQLPLYQNIPLATALHVVPSILVMTLLGFQLLSGLRKRYPRMHRYLGRVIVTLSVIIALSGSYIAFVMPFGANAETLVSLFVSAVFLYFLASGVTAIKRKDVEQHRKSMLRMTATALTPVTMRLIYSPSLMLFDISARDAFAPSLVAALLLNLIIMNVYLHKRRSKRSLDTPLRGALGTI